MARICAFCGKDDVTKEHLFARWIRDTYREFMTRGPSAMALERDDSVVWQYSGDTLEQGVNGFCARCNNGWMSQLEVRAASVMQPMIRGEITGPVKMRYTEQAKVASWAMKTALVLQQLHPTVSFIPTSDYRDFCRKQEPSSNVLIVMGMRHIAGSSKGANVFEYKGLFTGNPTRGIQHVHFAVGAVYLGLAIFIGCERRKPLLSYEVGNSLNIIWPLVKPQVMWPTPSIIPIGGIEGLFNAIVSALGG
jgi:hypothetical protein